jgi:hypothetical protein
MKYLIIPYILILLAVVNVSCHRSDTEYIDFYGTKHHFISLESKEIQLLFSNKDYDKTSLKKILDLYDSAYILAARISGEEPSIDSAYREKLTLAVVPDTCGSGCGKLGMKGIELTEKKFDEVYRLFVDSAKHDHIFFYELGRNFWFYEAAFTLPNNSEVEYIRTGFAIFLRNVLINKLKIEVGNINGVPYNQYLENSNIYWAEFVRNRGGSDLLQDLIDDQSQTYNKPLLWSMYWWNLFVEEKYSLEFLAKYLNDIRNRKPPESIDDLILNLTDSYETATLID